jgi:hypothetical protein
MNGSLDAANIEAPEKTNQHKDSLTDTGSSATLTQEAEQARAQAQAQRILGLQAQAKATGSILHVAAPAPSIEPVEVKLSGQQLDHLARNLRNSLVDQLVREVRDAGAIALSVRHAAAAVNCSASLLREAIERRELPAFSMGGTGDLRILPADLQMWVCGAPAMDPDQVARRKARRHGRSIPRTGDKATGVAS